MFDPETYRFSASQLSTWAECQRKWGFKYVEKIETPAGKGAALGSLVHKQLEKYLEHGTPLDFLETTPDGVKPAEIAAPGLHLLPAPMSEGLQVEQHLSFRSEKTGFRYHGYTDWTLEPVPGVRATPTIGDHKTTSGLQWAKTEDDLRHNDIQATIYAEDAFRKYGTPEVALQWTYLQTRGPKKAHPVRLTVLRHDVARNFEAVEAIAGEVAGALTSNVQVLDLRPNADACDGYGGCPFRGRCNLAPNEGRFRGMNDMNTKSGTRSLLDVLNERAGAAPVTAASPPVASGMDLIAMLTQKTPAPPPVQPTRATDVTNFDADAERAARGVATDMPVNPPEWQPPPTAEEREAPKATAAPKAEGPTGTRFRRTAAEIAAGLSVEAAKAARAANGQTPMQAQADSDQAMAAPELEPRMVELFGAEDAARLAEIETRDLDAPVTELAALGQELQPEAYTGILTKGRIHMAVPHTEAPGAFDRFVAEQDPAVMADAREEVAASMRPWTLYIDCLPADRTVVQATTLIRQAHKALEEAEGVSDYRLLAYGKGAALLSYGVAELARTAGRDIFLDSRTPEGGVVKDRLASVATSVVQGLK